MSNIIDPKVILALGACFTYDFIRNNYPKSTDVKFIWRSSIPSMVSESIENFVFPSEIIDKAELKTLQTDFFKDPPFIDLISQADLLVMDLIKDTYQTIEYKNNFFTYGVEQEKYNIIELLPGANLYKYGTSLHLEIFFKSLSKFSEIVRATQIPKILIGAGLSHFSYDTTNNKVELLENDEHHEIFIRARYLYMIEKIFTTFFPDFLYIPLPHFLQNFDKNHPWGVNPVHYRDHIFTFIFNDSVSSCICLNMLKDIVFF
jgi:hypothetical protein